MLTLSKSLRPANPVQGVKESKPRFKSAREELPELSRSYLEIRNQQMRTKNLTAEMELAERRGEVIEKKLVERQAAYLLVAMRQAALNIPQPYYRRILNVKEPREAKEILREAMISLLNTMKDLPKGVSNPNWLAKVEEDGGK